MFTPEQIAQIQEILRAEREVLIDVVREIVNESGLKDDYVDTKGAIKFMGWGDNVNYNSRAKLNGLVSNGWLKPVSGRPKRYSVKELKAAKKKLQQIN